MIDYNILSDIELVDLLKSDNHMAFNQIFERYSPILLSFAFRRLNDKELAKDFIHEVFVDLWAKRLRLNIPGDFQSYLFTVVKNRILNHYKHTQVSQRYLENFRDYLIVEQNATDHLVRYNNLSALIDKEVAALPEKMRIVFELSRKTSLTRKEIAAELNIPEETVKSRMRHAIKILRSRLGILLILTYLLQ